MTKHKKVLLILLLIPILTSTIAKPYGYYEQNARLETEYPYLARNIEAIVLAIIGAIALKIGLENKSCFEDSPSEETENIKNIAKDLGFSENKIANLSIKKPKKNTDIDNAFKNNYMSFFNTIIIGRQKIDKLKEATKDPNVKKFVYGHELSHAKYNHSVKILLTAIIAPLIVELTVRAINSTLCKAVENLETENSILSTALRSLKLNNFNNAFKKILDNVPAILDSAAIKSILQAILTISTIRQFEKNADLGAASLGPDAISGGIKYLEAANTVTQDQDAATIESYENKFVKKLISVTLACKNFITKLLDVHPSCEERIKYLQAKLLELKNQAKLEKAKQDAQNAQARIA